MSETRQVKSDRLSQVKPDGRLSALVPALPTGASSNMSEQQQTGRVIIIWLEHTTLMMVITASAERVTVLVGCSKGGKHPSRTCVPEFY